VPGPHRVLGYGDELLAHAHVWRRVEAAAGAAPVVVVVICGWGASALSASQSLLEGHHGIGMIVDVASAPTTAMLLL
jgi:hypothetical protein